MKYHILLFCIFLVLNSCSDKNVKRKNETVNIEHDILPVDTPSENTPDYKEIPHYKVIINNGAGASVHKNQLKSIIGKIDISETQNTIHVYVNNDSIVEEFNNGIHKYGNLLGLCSESKGSNFVVGDNSLFQTYHDYERRYRDNKLFYIDTNLILFLSGCHSFNVFVWQVFSDTLKLKTVLPDFISIPDAGEYFTRLYVSRILTGDSVNYFLAGKTHVEWRDADRIEGEECDEDDKIWILHYNSKDYLLNKIYQINQQGEDQQYDIELDNSLLIFHSTYLVIYGTISVNKESGDTAILSDIPDDYFDYWYDIGRKDETKHFYDTILIDKYLK